MVRIYVGKELWATVAPGAEATALEGMVRTHAGEGRDVWNPVIRQMMFAECFGPEGLTLCEKDPGEAVVPGRVQEEWSRAVEAAAAKVSDDLEASNPGMKEFREHLDREEFVASVQGVVGALALDLDRSKRQVQGLWKRVDELEVEVRQLKSAVASMVSKVMSPVRLPTESGASATSDPSGGVAPGN